ncbi:MAG: O-antigen ligase family protein [Candidatus Magasanikbacteria bacterium]|nr:O-antigen ligase family protein [Candidatus Magasanikbacteria bacterium]
MRSSTLRNVLLCLIGATFITPMIMAPAHFIFPFIVPKIIFFRTLVLLLLGGYIVLLSSKWDEFRLRFSPVTIAVLLFLASFFISTVVGIDWYHSLWDNHERMLGLFTIIHYVLLFLIASSIVKDEHEWRWLLRGFLLAGGIVMFIGLLQRFEPSLLLNQSGDRVASTLGNPIYVGGYGLFLSCVGWLLAMKEEKKIWRIFAIVTGGLGFLGIFLSGTRGSVLGLIAGIITLGLSYLIMMKEHGDLRKKVFIALSGFLVLLVILFAFRQTNFVKDIPGLGNLLNSFSSVKGTVATRIMAWGIAFEGWQERPAFGWGPNNFYYIFNKFYRPEFLEHGWSETWFDNAHNIIMNTLAVQGAFGLICYLGMFATVIIMLWRARVRYGLDKHVVAVGIAFLVEHLTHSVFVFENPTSYLYFFFFLAYLNGIVYLAEKKTEINSTANSVVIPIGFSSVVSVIILLFIYSTNINPARANMASLLSLQSLYTMSDPIGQYKTGASIPTPHIDDIRTDFSRTVTQTIQNYVEIGRGDDAKKLIELAREELAKNIQLHPTDIRTHILLADLNQHATMMNQKIEYLQEAEALLTDALVQSPKRQQIQFSLAMVKLNLQKFDDAIELMKQSIRNNSKISEGWWRLAFMYKQIGRNDMAEATIREAWARGISFNSQGSVVVNEIVPSGQNSTPTPNLPAFSLE